MQQRCIIGKGVFKKFAKFTGKHYVNLLYLNLMTPLNNDKYVLILHPVGKLLRYYASEPGSIPHHTNRSPFLLSRPSFRG